MSVPIFDSAAWREFRGTPSGSTFNKTTHFAKICDQTGQLRNCVVKIPLPKTPSLVGEAIGWLLAGSVQVPRVPFAAIIMVPLNKLRSSFQLPSEFDGLDEYPGWCCELAGESVVTQIHTWGYAIACTDCLQSADTRKIASFDLMSDLRDRNYGNVIRTPQGSYISIDHETILHDLIWIPFGKKFGENSLYKEAQKLLPADAFSIFLSDMVKASQAHSSGWKLVRSDVIGLISKLWPHCSTAQVLEMLDQRSEAGWLATSIGVPS